MGFFKPLTWAEITKWLKTLEQKENDVMFMKELSESLFLVLRNSSV